MDLDFNLSGNGNFCASGTKLAQNRNSPSPLRLGTLLIKTCFFLLCMDMAVSAGSQAAQSQLGGTVMSADKSVLQKTEFINSSFRQAIQYNFIPDNPKDSQITTYYGTQIYHTR